MPWQQRKIEHPGDHSFVMLCVLRRKQPKQAPLSALAINLLTTCNLKRIWICQTILFRCTTKLGLPEDFGDREVYVLFYYTYYYNKKTRNPNRSMQVYLQNLFNSQHFDSFRRGWFVTLSNSLLNSETRCKSSVMIRFVAIHGPTQTTRGRQYQRTNVKLYAENR